MSARTVVIYSDLQDPVALQALSSPQLEISCVHVDQMIPLLTRRDWPEVLELAPTAEVEGVFKDAWIINRVFILTGTKLLACLQEWGVNERWFHIRLQKILSLGSAASYDTGVRGVSRSLLPLNAQWLEIKRSLTDLATPDFKEGIDMVFSDLNHSPENIQSLLGAFIPQMRETSSIFIDSASTHRLSYLALERIVDLLNQGRLPAGIVKELNQDEARRLQDRVTASSFRLMHLVEATNRAQNSTAWLRIEPIDIHVAGATFFH